MFGRTKIAMLVGEFFGVALLTSVVLAVANSQIGFPLFIAAAAGLTVGVMYLVVGWSSGAHLNPAITVSLWTLGKTKTTEAIAFIASQLLGGVAALSLFQYLTAKTLPNVAGKEFEWRILVAEAIGTFIFAFGVTAAVTRLTDDWSKATAIGVSLMLGILVASTASNAVLNPAVAIGLRSVSRAYVAGPIIGAVLGANVYNMLFAPVKGRSKRGGWSAAFSSLTKPTKRR